MTKFWKYTTNRLSKDFQTVSGDMALIAVKGHKGCFYVSKRFISMIAQVILTYEPTAASIAFH